MNNMLAETMSEVAATAIRHRRDGVAVTFDMLVKPDVKHFKQGMPMDVLSVTFVNHRVGEHGIEDVTVVIRLKKVSAKGQMLMNGSKELQWAEARHFLRAQFATQKLFDFKQHEPFYTVTDENDHKQTV
jgi:hypothetical protein